MANSCARRVIVLLVAAAVLASACGSADSDTLPAADSIGGGSDTVVPIDRGRAVIDLLAEGEIAQQILGGAERTGDVVLVADIAPTPSTAGLWRYPTGATVDADQVTGLAEALGVDGEIEQRDDGTWTVGVGDGTADFLSVQSQFGSYFNSQLSQTDQAAAGAIPCTTVVDGPAECGTPGLEVPKPALVTDVVERVLATLGISPGDVEVVQQPQGSAVGAEFRFVPDGIRSDVRGYFVVAGDGRILLSSGPTSGPVRVGDVPVVDLDTAVARFEAAFDRGVVGTFPPLTTIPIRSSSTGVGVEPAPTTTERSQVTIVAAEQVLATIFDAYGQPWVVPAYELIDDVGITTTIIALTPESIRIVDPADIAPPTTQFAPVTSVATPVVPPYTTTSTPLSSERATVPFTTTSLAPTGSTLPRPTLPGPDATILIGGVPATVPVPPDPNEVDLGSVTEVRRVTDIYEADLAMILVGRGLADAELVLRRTGWEVRVVDLDGSTGVTADFRSNRVTLVHRNGIVERVQYG